MEFAEQSERSSAFQCILCVEKPNGIAINVEKFRREVKRGRVSYKEKTIRPLICNDCWLHFRIEEKCEAYRNAERERLKKLDAELAKYEAARNSCPVDDRSSREAPPAVECWDALLGIDPPHFYSYNPWDLLDNDPRLHLKWVCDYLMDDERVKDVRRMADHEFLDTPYWRALRWFALSVNSFCNRCERTRALDIHWGHHRPPLLTLDDITKLETVCAKCAGPYESYQRVNPSTVVENRFKARPADIPGQQKIF